MKKVLFLILSAVMLTGCFVTKPSYPAQKETRRKEVPKAITFIDKMPIIEEIGDVKIIHDVRNNAFIFFKGANDSVLNKLNTHLNTPAMAKDPQTGADVQLRPVGAFVMTTIRPYTMFTSSELRKMKGRDRSRIVEIAQYKAFAITVQDYTYVEFLHPDELAMMYGRPVGQQNPQVMSPNPNQGNNNQPSQQRRSILGRYY